MISRRLRRHWLALAAGLSLVPVVLAQDREISSGRGAIGEWDLVWRVSRTEGLTNDFRRVLGDAAQFPIHWRRIRSSQGDQLFFFDADGKIEETVSLAPGQQAMAAADGRSYLVWSEDPTDVDDQRFGFFQRGEPEAAWSATAPGDPVLMAPDGSFFVIASRPEGVPQFTSADSRGKIQVVGFDGEIRGELPIFPFGSQVTGDGERIAFLHNREVIVLGRDGILDWRRRVPVDNLTPREGMSHLQTGSGMVIVSGTGSSSEGSGGSTLQPGRVGAIRVFDDFGRLIWKHDQPLSDDLWFQLVPALSQDGSAIATSHSTSKEIVVRLFDSATGELVWSRSTRRQSGVRSLCVSDELVLIAHSDARTNVVAWDRLGNVVWEGVILLPAKLLSLTNDDLLVSTLWILRLRIEP